MNWYHNKFLEVRNSEVTEEVQSNASTLLESMKKFYDVAGDIKGIQDVMKEAADSVSEFVKKNQGQWDQAEWEAFLKDLQKKGVTLNEETQTYIGNILEVAKEVYVIPEILKKGV